MKNLFLLLFILNSSFSFAVNTDSLWNVINTGKNDTDRVKCYNALGIAISANDLDSSIVIYNQGIELAKQHNFKKLEAALLTNKGFSLKDKGALDLSDSAILEAITIYESIGALDRVSYNYFTLGTFRANDQKFKKSLKYFELAYNIGKELEDNESMLGMICNNLGLIYGYLEQRAQSIDFKIKAIKLKEQINDPTLAISIMNLSLDYFNNQEYSKAIDQLEKSNQLLSNDSTQKKAICLQMLVQNYMVTEKIQEANKYLDELTRVANSLQDSHYIAISHLERGNLQSLNREFKEAHKSFDMALNNLPKNQPIRTLAQIHINHAKSLAAYFDSKNENSEVIIQSIISKSKKALDLSVNTGAVNDQLISLELLQSFFEKNNDDESALKYAKRYITLKDSMLIKQERSLAADLKYKYGTEKNELEIELLNRENELKQNYLDQATQKSKQQQIIIFISLIGLTLTIGIVFLLYKQSKQRQKNNKNLLVKNQTIAKQNEEKELLLKEIHHRVKNNLQVISSLLELQAKKVSETESEVFKEGQSRVRAMALIHEELYQKEDLAEVDFKSYTAKLSRQIQSLFPGKEKVAISIEGPVIKLDIDTAIPLGLILNELVTNAFKYGLDENGKLDIEFNELEKGNYSVQVSDSGKGLPKDFDIKKSKSLGLRLVTRLARQLYGKAVYSNEENSTFEISFKDTIERKKVA